MVWQELISVLQADSSKYEIARAMWEAQMIPLLVMFLIFPIVYLIFGLLAIDWKSKKNANNFIGLFIITMLLSVILWFAYPYFLALML